MKFATQKLATRAAVLSIFASFGIKYEPTVDCRPLVDGNKNVKDAVVIELVRMIEADETPLASKQEDNKRYCVGLLNNWLRRDEALNGNTVYVSKKSHSDPGIKEARKLLATLTDAKDIAMVQKTIDEMVATKAKEKAPEIDVSKLPESLRGLVKAA